MTDVHDEPDELVYLSFDGALEIFATIVGGTAAQAADQLRSRDALEGALGRPQSYAHYEQADMTRVSSSVAEQAWARDWPQDWYLSGTSLRSA